MLFKPIDYLKKISIIYPTYSIVYLLGHMPIYLFTKIISMSHLSYRDLIHQTYDFPQLGFDVNDEGNLIRNGVDLL